VIKIDCWPRSGERLSPPKKQEKAHSIHMISIWAEGSNRSDEDPGVLELAHILTKEGMQYIKHDGEKCVQITPVGSGWLLSN
jgi:hypothetical protein